jgi:hypothetical protein
MTVPPVPGLLLEVLDAVKSRWLVTITVLFVGRLLLKRYGSLRDIPGPFTASFTRLWKLRQMYKGDFEKTNIALHKKYGGLYLDITDLRSHCAHCPERSQY